MARPQEVDFWEWNRLIGDIHTESDRAAALAAGAFIENYLGLYIAARLPVGGLEVDLFAQGGPLEVFHNRILLARALDFIPKQAYEDLKRIRKIRNRFAHHPLQVTFADDQVVQLARLLSQQSDDEKDVRQRSRLAYLFTIATFCGSVYVTLEKRGLLKAAAPSKRPDPHSGTDGVPGQVTRSE